MTRNFLWLCFLTFGLTNYLPLSLTAQQVGVEMLAPREGLSQGYINCILQDREGFIWIGTKNGLNRYDGYRFEVLTHDPYDVHSLSDDHVNSLAEYGDFLIVGTQSNGLNLLHKKTQRVYRIPNSVFLPGTVPDYVSVLWAAADAVGQLWAQVDIPPNSNRLYRIALPKVFWQNPDAQVGNLQALNAQTWPRQMWSRAALSHDARWIYAIVRDTLFQVDVQTSAWSQVALLPGLGTKNLKSVELDAQGRIWIADFLSNDLTRLYRLSPDGRLVPVAVPPHFYRIQHFTPNLVWMACHSENVAFRLDEAGNFDPNSPAFPPVQVPRGHSFSITDRSGLVWMGTCGIGAVKVNLRSQHFYRLFPQKSIYGGVFQDRNGNVTTYDNLADPLFSSELAKNPNAPFLPSLHHLHSNTKIAEDAQGNYWIAGTDRDTRAFLLKKISPAGSVATFPIPLSITYFDYVLLALDGRGHPWVAADSRLFHFDPAAERFDTWDFQKTLPEAKGVTALAQTADGSWWIGMDKGLVRAAPVAQGFNFSAFKNDPTDRNSLRHNLVSSLLTDPSDPSVLWVGTKGGGLNRLDTRTGRFIHLTTREGLPNDVIYGVLADGDGDLWMSSNKGLTRYEPATGLMKTYTEEDGIQGNEFNTWAYGKAADGTLLFGGVNGLTVFHPSRLLTDTVAPRTLLTGLRLNDRPVPHHDSTGTLRQGMEFTQAIRVPFSSNNITLEFAAMNFAAPVKNRFRYYLQGAEAEWAHESAERSATYLNLSPGTYTFWVKGSNSEGVWSEQATALKIIVLPPWYRTWWAWLAYTLVLGGSAYAFYRYQLQTKLEHAENERLKELDAVKTRLYTNITHDFRTPLTVILGMADQLRQHFLDRAEQAFDTGVEMIRRNGQQLLQLINQVLDLSKLESGTMRLHLVQGDVVAFVKYLTESFQSYAESKNVTLRFEAEPLQLSIAYDREKLQAIVSNLISNAIKFTPSGGKVNVELRIENLELDTQRPSILPSPFSIVVSDTGVGIPAEKLPHIFDRFYQVDNSATRANEGTGIGLALVRELVKLMGGDIAVESRPGVGTVFSATLPAFSVTEDMAQVRPEDFSAPLLPLLAEPPQSDPPPADGLANDAPLVLLVEDNTDVRRYLAQCLRDQYRIIEAHDGQQGIDLALEQVPDLVVSDVMMPHKDGFEVCAALKNDDRTSHIPIVLLTARAAVEDRIAGLRRGADAYLTKPFHRAELLVTLEKLIESRRRLQARYSQMFAGEPLDTAPTADAPADDEVAVVEDVFLQKLRDIVEAHLSDAEFDMNQLSRAAGMSHSQIFRKLKALMGRSPSAFIRSVRLRHAADLLKNTALTVSEIAYETGFTSPAYFSTMFLEEFGKTPTESR